MPWNRVLPLAFGLLAMTTTSVMAAEEGGKDISALYVTHCGECHGPDRLGRMGPALLPENLGRLKKAEATQVIAKGRPAAQMQAFEGTLTPEQIAGLVDLVFTPLAHVPEWGMTEITASHVTHTEARNLVTKPGYDADPLNLFTVVETGDHHVTILDGDRFEPLWRFKSRFALHGGAKYSPDGRFVYLASRDGWVSKYDLWGLVPVAEIRAGINTRNIAVSGDGKWVMVGNYLPRSAVILNAADLTPFRVIPVADAKGTESRVSAVYAAPPRKSFVVALKDVAELWEMSWDPEAPPVYGDFVHSYEEGKVEGVPVGTQPFAIRRVVLEDYLDDFFFDETYSQVIGASRDGKQAHVYNLDVRRRVATLDLPGMPHLGSGIYWRRNGVPVLATPHLKENRISIIDMKTWSTLASIETLGPGFFMRSHMNTPYAWTDVFFGPNKDAMHVIDKQSLKIVATPRPEPGKTAAHVEFTRDGRFALVSIWEMDGALVVYDAATLQEVKRIPMSKPSGKYNVYNKITYAEGTSH